MKARAMAAACAAILGVHALGAQTVESVRALQRVGRYDEAETAARKGAAGATGAAMLNTLGEVLRDRGKIAAAESAFVRGAASHAPDSLTALVNLAELHFNRGERDRAMKEFDRFIGIYNGSAGTLTSAEMTAVGIACRYLGRDNPELFKDALKAFDRAIAIDANNNDAKIDEGNLLLDKYNSADAQTAFAEVLATDSTDPRALLGEAKRRIFDSESGVDSLMTRALAINPNFVEARAQRAQMLMEIEEYPLAEKEAARALSVNPSSSEALAVLAAVRYVAGDTKGFEEARQRAFVLNPSNAAFYVTMSAAASRIRLYAVADSFALMGIAADPKSWDAYGLAGMNQMRLGQIAEGRKSLEASFAGDPYNIWVKNTLDLLDTFKNYDESTSGNFTTMIEKDESPILSIYLRDLAERAYATFQQHYQFTPAPPIRVEVYRSHADFSVRTVGLAGLGALGVSFGRTLAFDSPAAKDAGPFNWGSTVWHELAHTFTLGLTDQHVPRWLSEGLSVYEEHHARPGWGSNVSVEFLDAFAAGKLVPVSRMNDGFMRPAFPEQVILSYHQASVVCDMIAHDYGEKAILQMLLEYKAGRTTPEVFQKVFGMDMKAFDRKFDAYMRERYAGPLAALKDTLTAGTETPPAELLAMANASPRSYRIQMLAAATLAKAGQADAAIPLLERARDLFPEYGGGDGPYAGLAQLYAAKGDSAKAAGALAQYVLHNETDYDAHLELARFRTAAGDKAGAADALDRSIYINPFNVGVHQELASLDEALGNKAGTVRERRAVVALAPADKAEAFYQLARAYHAAGDDASARKAVVHSLEEAPNYVRAQELLLQIIDGKP
ncbi:MAG: peptidase MA family metallohydrolase [Gemmatimonadales bacterium]